MKATEDRHSFSARNGSALGNLRLRLDPWQADFGPEFTGFDDVAGDDSENADLKAESPLTEWKVSAPPPGPTLESVWFIDGVRRIEARVTVEADGHYTYGGFGAFAVGAVWLASSEALFERILRGRILALCSTEQPDTSVSVAPGLTYIPVRVKESEPDAPLRAIHGEMRKAEETLGRELASEPGRLVIVDGPLTFEEASRGAAVGYIKRVMKIYLPPAQLPTLVALSPGQRTPLFALRGSTRFSRLSWFLRLTDARRGDSEFSGIVRMEVAESVGVDAARQLADSCSTILPGLKSRRGLDQRAPQNLLPIGALEKHLRRKLGDERIVRRRIESFLVRESQ